MMSDLALSGPLRDLTDPDPSTRQRRVEVIAMTIVVLNVLDVLVTQYILRTHPASHEGNGVLVQIIMSPWVWIPKIGLPLIVLATSSRREATRITYLGIATVWLIYWAVISWNFHILLTPA